LAALLAAAAACGTRAPGGARGTKRMADTLAFLYARAAAQPGSYEFMNRERADALQLSAFQQGHPASFQDRYSVARELLLAGRTREAIGQLERLQRGMGIALDPGFPENKPFFDLLGVSYLRLGEQENCNLNPNVSVCILGELHHTQQEGARHAIDVYQDILRAFPDDRGSQWLLNIAYMAVGGYPSQVPKQYLIPNIGLKHDPSFPLFFNAAQNVGADVTGLAGGLCIEDFNRDGLLDLFTTSWGLNDPPHYLVADGHGGYVDRTAQAGLKGIVGGANCKHADYDNDGYDDVFITRGAWLGDGGEFPNSLLHNRGDGTFEDVTFAAGVGSMHPTHTAAWADFNLDGYLDLFVGNESGVGMGWSSHPSELFLNNHDGTFTEVSHKVGIDVDAFVKGVTWGDVNNDGLPDLYVSVFGGPNRLYINRGGKSIDTWHFEEVAAKAGVQRPYMSFATWFWDYDNDGWEDLLVLSYDNRVPLHTAVAREYLGLPPIKLAAGMSNGPDSVEHTHLYRNKHDGTFEDVSESVGLADKAIYAMGSNFGDIDNDGWLDFYVGTGNPDLRSVIPNRMFRNVDGRRFEEVTLQGGFGHLQKGHGTAFADLDRDGDEDVYMMVGGAYAGDVSTSVLFENPGFPNRSWITLNLEGRTANRSAIGARVEIVAADSSGATRTIHRTVGADGSFGSGSLQLHVGLGAAVRVPRVRVTWPDSLRSTSTYDNLAPKQTYLLVQGRGAQLLDRPPVPFRHSAPASIEHHDMPRH
jgi:ASPIC/UnbV protein/VCBS repeat protein